MIWKYPKVEVSNSSKAILEEGYETVSIAFVQHQSNSHLNDLINTRSLGASGPQFLVAPLDFALN